MKLNLGAGDRYAEGFWNVDWASSPYDTDQRVDLRGELPWIGVDYAYAGHLLEHLTLDECRSFLPRLLACMSPGGQLMVVGPDLTIATQMAEAGTLNVLLDELRYGAKRWPGDEHHWLCDVVQVVDLLQTAGWANVQDVGISNVPAMWPVADRGPQWQCAVSATKE